MLIQLVLFSGEKGLTDEKKPFPWERFFSVPEHPAIQTLGSQASRAKGVYPLSGFSA